MSLYFKENDIPLSAAADSAPAMTGRYKGVIAFLKRAVKYTRRSLCDTPPTFSREKLSKPLHTSLRYVIRDVIKKQFFE